MTEEDLELQMSEEQEQSVTSNDSPRGAVIDDVDAHNVFIKFLPTTLTDSGLFALFSQFGDIKSCRVMVDPITGNSLGYGFCRFSKAEEAQRAIETMSGHHIGNKTLLCKLSHGPSHSLSPPNDNLYIKPLLSTTSEDDLRKLFEPFGVIRECKVMVDKNTGISRQIGFVRFESMDDARNALEKMNGYVLVDPDSGANHTLVVKFAESQPQKLSRRARLLANQSAAAARRYAAQLQQQQQQQQQQQFQVGAPIVASSTAMLGDGTVEQDSRIVGVPAEILIPPIVAMRRARGRGGSRGGMNRRRRPRFSERPPRDLSPEENHLQDVPESEVATQDPLTSPTLPPTPAGKRSFAQVAAGAAAAPIPIQSVLSSRSSSPPAASTEVVSDSPQSAQRESAVMPQSIAEPESYSMSTEEYPGYTATTTVAFDPDAAAFFPQYPAGMAYYYQNQYGQYTYVPAAEGAWYPDPNAAIFVPSPQSQVPPGANYVPISALDPSGNGGVYYPTAHRGRGGKHRGSKRGGRGSNSSRGRFGLPGFFQAHLPPFYGPQSTSFPSGPNNSSSSLPAPIPDTGYSSFDSQFQANPLYPYPFVDPTNLFVFHLPITLDEKGLKKLFEPFGRVEGVRVARDKQTRKSKGYGFVKFRRMQDAIQAVMEMNGYTVENKHLKVAFKSAFRDRLPARRRNPRNRHSRPPGEPTEEHAAQNPTGAKDLDDEPGFSDEPDSDEDAAFDRIVEQENQREQDNTNATSSEDGSTDHVASSSAVVAH